MDCNLPGSSVHGILQARVLEWVAIPFSSIMPKVFSPSFVFRQISALVLNCYSTSADKWWTKHFEHYTGFSNTWTENFQMFTLVLEKAEEPEIKLPISAGSSKKQEFQKNIYFCFIDYSKAFNCVDHNKLWKILKEMGIPDHLTCLLRNLYACWWGSNS